MSPACGREGQRSIAAKIIGEIDVERPRVQAVGVDPGEKAAAAAAAPAAGLQPQRLAVGATRGIGAEPARVAQTEAQFGAVEIHVGGRDPMPREVRREGEARLARYLRVVDHGFIDRALAPLRA